MKRKNNDTKVNTNKKEKLSIGSLQIKYIDNAPKYKCILGAILKKDENGFLVKTNDSFVEIVEYEYDGKFRVGDRFEVK